MDQFVRFVGLFSKVFWVPDFDRPCCKKLDEWPSNKNNEGFLQCEQRVVGVWWWDRILGVWVVSSVQVWPQNSFFQTEKADFVLITDEALCVFDPNIEGNLLPFPMMQQIEKAHRRYKYSYQWKNPSEGGKGRPSHYYQLWGGGTKPFFQMLHRTESTRTWVALL